MTVDPQELRRRAEELGIEFYFAQFVDMYARPSAKLVPAAYWDDLINDGAGFAGFAAGEIGQGPHHPDISAIPDLSSFTPVPWQPNLARFACDIQVDGEEWPYDPRTILRRQLEPDPLHRGVEVEDVDEEGAARVAGPDELVHDGCRGRLGVDADDLTGLDVGADLDEQRPQPAVQVFVHGAAP